MCKARAPSIRWISAIQNILRCCNRWIRLPMRARAAICWRKRMTQAFSARARLIIAEAGSGGQEVAKKRVEWEAARRAGRSSQLCVTTDRWRDASGALWTPNTQIEVRIPAMQTEGNAWVLAEVRY